MKKMMMHPPSLLVLIACFHCCMLALQDVLSWCCFAAAASPTSATSSGLTYRLYENAALAGTPDAFGVVSSAQLSLIKETTTSSAVLCYLSGELQGTITFSPAAAAQDGGDVYEFQCRFLHTSTGWVWIDGHLVCGDGNAYLPSKEMDNPLPILRKKTLPFRVHITSNDTNCEKIASLQVYWKKVDARSSFQLLRHQESSQNASNSSAIRLSPNLPPAEQQREVLQRNRQHGWGSWLRADILSMVKLPEGLVLTPIVCHRSSRKCLTRATPDDTPGVRVDLHAYDKSYVGYNLTLFDNHQLVVQVEYTTSGDQQLQCLITLHNNNKNSTADDDYIVGISARFAWFRPGTISTTIDQHGNLGLSYKTPGLGVVNVTMLHDAGFLRRVPSPSLLGYPYSTTSSRRDLLEYDCEETAVLTFRLQRRGNNGVASLGLVAGMSKQLPTLDEMAATIQNNKAAEYQRLQQKFGRKTPVAEAIQCAVMWNFVYIPVENGPFLPVSRSDQWSFSDRSGAVHPDWTYVIFEWDNFFASLLAGLDNKEVAYSNLFQVVKSKTAQGFIPNYATGGGAKSQDRTEPPVGAKVTLELYQKYKDKWMIEVVFDDLLDWNDWFLSHRLLSPAGLVALGSNNESCTRMEVNTMQAARFESGLDNSPMYDGNFFDPNVTHLMQLYDVGFASLFAQEAYALAELGEIIGRDASLVTMLRNRAREMKHKIQTMLWDETQQVFANRFPNGTFSRHLSPTSFYPLAVGGAATTQQIDSMLELWLFNSSRFCISQNGDFVGNYPNVCYWGLPSIRADDPTYMKGKFIYWRGYIWGPMAQLVYWSLRGAQQTPIVVRARNALCRQMEALVMSQWTRNRHICENYHPSQNATDCSGTKFYHWGALHGLIGMVEDGFW